MENGKIVEVIYAEPLDLTPPIVESVVHSEETSETLPQEEPIGTRS